MYLRQKLKILTQNMIPKVSMVVDRMLVCGLTGSSFVPIMRYANFLLYFSTVVIIFHAEHPLLEFPSVIYFLDIFETAIFSFWANLFLTIVWTCSDPLFCWSGPTYDAFLFRLLKMFIYNLKKSLSEVLSPGSIKWFENKITMFCIDFWLFHLHPKHPSKLAKKGQIRVLLLFLKNILTFIFLTILMKCCILSFGLIIPYCLPYIMRYQIEVQGAKNFYHCVILWS